MVEPRIGQPNVGRRELVIAVTSREQFVGTVAQIADKSTDTCSRMPATG